MDIVEKNIKWIMIVAGLLTCTMIYAVIAPEAALLNTFGESIDGPVANIVVRSWGTLITLIGVMLIYGAFRPVLRPFVIVVASISKSVFVGLILSAGTQFLAKAGITVAFDSLVVLVFLVYLITAKRST